MDENIETRVFDSEMRVTVDPNTPKIDGTAAVYNRMSEDLGGFREIIEPGFFENVLKGDTRALWNHNADLVLGRTKAGTLALEDTERGLDVHILPPDTQTGRDAVTLIKRGDVTQMSFAFRVRQPGGDEWIRDEKTGSIKRILKRGGASELFDVSPVTYPAYPQTSVHARSILAGLTEEGQGPDPEDEQLKQQILNQREHRQREIQLSEIKNTLKIKE